VVGGEDRGGGLSLEEGVGSVEARLAPNVLLFSTLRILEERLRLIRWVLILLIFGNRGRPGVRHLGAEGPDLVDGRRPVVVVAVGVAELPGRHEALEARRRLHWILLLLRRWLLPLLLWCSHLWLWLFLSRDGSLRGLRRSFTGTFELLGLLVSKDDLGLDDGHALGREPVELLL
jgi:hypothetical protein